MPDRSDRLRSLEVRTAFDNCLTTVRYVWCTGRTRAYKRHFVLSRFSGKKMASCGLQTKIRNIRFYLKTRKNQITGNLADLPPVLPSLFSRQATSETDSVKVVVPWLRPKLETDISWSESI